MEWIKCSERMPTPYTRVVFVYRKSGDVRFTAVVGSYLKNHKKWDNRNAPFSEIEEYEVICWLEIPPIPQSISDLPGEGPDPIDKDISIKSALLDEAISQVEKHNKSLEALEIEAHLFASQNNDIKDMLESANLRVDRLEKCYLYFLKKLKWFGIIVTIVSSIQLITKFML